MPIFEKHTPNGLSKTFVHCSCVLYTVEEKSGTRLILNDKKETEFHVAEPLNKANHKLAMEAIGKLS